MVALHRDIVRGTTGERPEMTIVGNATGPAQAGRAVADLGVDVLLLAAAGPASVCPYLDLMWTHPRVGMVVLDPRGALRELRLVEPVNGAGWSDELADAVRSAAGRPQPH